MLLGLIIARVSFVAESFGIQKKCSNLLAIAVHNLSNVWS
jgi:hypothetical protein